MVKTRILALLVFAASFGGAGLLRAEDCNVSTLNGGYGYSMNGTVYDRNYTSYLLAAVGVAQSDGNGNLTGSETLSFDGSIFRRKFTASYSINADCTGSATVTYSDNSVVHLDLVIVDDAKEVRVVQTDSPFIFSGALRRQKTPSVATTPAS